MTLTTYKWSIEEWHELVDAGLLSGKPVEFLEGEIVTVSPEGVEHRYTNSSIVKYLRSIFNKTAEIQESHPITLDNSEPEPDVAVVRLPETIAFGDSPLPKAMSDCSSSHRTRHPYPQDIYWLIEISNRTLKTDLNQKKITYARNGIPEYWVIDLKNKKLIVHTQIQGNNYTQVNEYSKGTISPLAFPNVAIALDKLLLY